MTKKHEELVEEIRLVWCEDCIDGPSRYEYAPDFGDEPCESGAETVKLCRERARECVAHTLSAVRDGLEIPGEVGRGEIVDGFMVDWDRDGDEEPMGLNCRFIALRPPTIELDEPSFIAEIH